MFHELDADLVRDLGTFPEITETMWYRIYLPELLPDVARVLYLDGDIIAMDTLEPLWATALGDHLVGAVTNVFMQGDEHPVAPGRVGTARAGRLLQHRGSAPEPRRDAR